MGNTAGTDIKIGDVGGEQTIKLLWVIQQAQVLKEDLWVRSRLWSSDGGQDSHSSLQALLAIALQKK